MAGKLFWHRLRLVTRSYTAPVSFTGSTAMSRMHCHECRRSMLAFRRSSGVTWRPCRATSRNTRSSKMTLLHWRRRWASRSDVICFYSSVILDTCCSSAFVTLPTALYKLRSDGRLTWKPFNIVLSLDTMAQMRPPIVRSLVHWTSLARFPSWHHQWLTLVSLPLIGILEIHSWFGFDVMPKTGV